MHTTIRNPDAVPYAVHTVYILHFQWSTFKKNPDMQNYSIWNANVWTSVEEAAFTWGFSFSAATNWHIFAFLSRLNLLKTRFPLLITGKKKKHFLLFEQHT